METREKRAKSDAAIATARMHHATAGGFYRVCVLAADRMNTVDTIAT